MTIETTPDFFVAEEAIIAIKNAKNLDVQALGEVLELIAAEPEGLTPRTLQVRASTPGHPAYAVAHHHYEWDNDVCGPKYRDGQSRALIRLVSWTEPKSDRTLPAFVSLRSDRAAGYRPTREVLSSDAMIDRMLEQAAKDLEAFEQRYKVLVEVVAIVREARSKIAARRKRYRRPDDGARPTT